MQIKHVAQHANELNQAHHVLLKSSHIFEKYLTSLIVQKSSDSIFIIIKKVTQIRVSGWGDIRIPRAYLSSTRGNGIFMAFGQGRDRDCVFAHARAGQYDVSTTDSYILLTCADLINGLVFFSPLKRKKRLPIIRICKFKIEDET
ncbi:hypothetical protein ACJX0J_027834, partial [Zea mays]